MMIKSKQLAMAFALVALAMPAGRALAGPIGDTGQFNQTRQAGYYGGNGGEFTVSGYGSSLNNASYSASTSNIGSMDPSFQTFCIEANEYVGGDPTYFIVNDKAVSGGTGGGSPDPISAGTAWLYSQFVGGVLAGYDYTAGAGRVAAATALQQAIWYLENESGGAANGFSAAAVTYFGSLAAAQADAASGAYGVYVLNTYGDSARTQKRQDFLYRVPDGGTTLALLGGALMGLGVLRRKFSI